jgi:hypothetical protein
MTKTLSETLDAMANAHAGRSETARLRSVFTQVEKALQSGVSRQAVLDALHQDGFTFSMQSFQKALYRIRKAQMHQEVATAPVSRSLAESPLIDDVPKVVTGSAVKHKRPSVTRADLIKIRQQDHDWVALSQPVKD